MANEAVKIPKYCLLLLGNVKYIWSVDPTRRILASLNLASPRSTMQIDASRTERLRVVMLHFNNLHIQA